MTMQCKRAVEMLWEYSLDRGVRYKTMVSDGNSRTYKHLCGLKVYGDTTKLVKEKCVNHVSKRMGTALRKLKNTGVSLGGRGHGKLTDNVTNRLQIVYNNAIHTHRNELQEMQDAVFASFEHASLTDERPDIEHCPKGKDS